MNPAPLPPQATMPYGIVGRYAVFEEIAAGGMATVHLGKLLGAGGFSRIVAIKRLHPQFAKDAEFAAMFMDEARLAARIHHPNVVQTLDVVTVEKELLLVMEYVHGAAFSSLLGTSRRTGKRVSPRIVAGVILNVLEGLHAAHDAKSEVGVPLNVVHRDVSPQNVLVGVEGIARILDFGVAKAMGKMHATREGQLKGKLAYMSPEQVRSQDVTRASDVFSTAIVLWEALTGERLFNGQTPAELIMQVLDAPIPSPRTKYPDLSPALEAVVMKGLSRDVAGRYATARDMAVALENAVGVAPARDIGQWVEAIAGEALATRARLLEAIERAAASIPPPGERSSVEGLPAGHVPRGIPEARRDRSDPQESGPRPTSEPGSSRSAFTDDDPLPFDRAAPSPRSDRPASSSQTMPAVGRRTSPPLSDPDPTSELAPPSSGARAAPGAEVGNDDLLARMSSPPGAPRPRPQLRPPVRIQDDDTNAARTSLRERLDAPLKLVAIGVVISVLDWAAREYTASLPIRPSWFAEALVIAGVIWAAVRVFF
jgi:eukaryotic-like serine/threonine-protein kinase